MSAFPIDLNGANFLDTVRLNNGNDVLKTEFYNLACSDTGKAIELINDKNLLFPSLFVLQSEIIKFDLADRLCTRNKYALEIVNNILSRKLSGIHELSSLRTEDLHSLLVWILETGFADDGLNDRYDEVMETVAIILIKTYKDTGCLGIIAEMIFSRHRSGSIIYDLIWTFFESCDPQRLAIAAYRLRSGNRKDVQLARKLLAFIPCVGKSSTADNIEQYNNVAEWINENGQFIYHTGGSLLQNGTLCPYAFSSESKYLQKNIHNAGGEAPRMLPEDERRILEGFIKLEDNEKLLLSAFSHMLHRRSIRQWNEWIHCPLAKQISIARLHIGDRYDKNIR